MIQLPRVRCQLVSHTLSECGDRAFTIQIKSELHTAVHRISHKRVSFSGGGRSTATSEWRPAVVSGKWQIGLTPVAQLHPQGAGQHQIISCSKSDLQFIIFGFKNRSLSHVPRSKLVFSHNYQVLRIRYAAFGILGNLSSSHNKAGLKGLNLMKPFTKYLLQNWEVGCNTKTS